MVQTATLMLYVSISYYIAWTFRIYKI